MQARRAMTGLAVLLAAGATLLAGPAQAQSGDTPVVYLTFDDGPSDGPVTTELLDVLADHGAKATFFVQEPDVVRNPDVVAAISAAGHAIGNHSDGHTDVLNKTPADLIRRFEATENALAAAGAPPASCWRAPFGATDPQADLAAASLGLGPAAIRWTVDTKDWSADTTTAQIRATLDTVGDGDIVLMHDGQGDRSRTLTAVRQFLTERGDDFRFEVLPDCQGDGEPPSDDFGDVAAATWYANAVRWAALTEVTTGTGPGVFSPGDPVTRGQAVTFLWRSAGEPVVDPVHDFADVSAGAFYEQAVHWAANNGITQGLGPGTFGPNQPITRAQAVTFLWRANGRPAVGAHPFIDVRPDDWFDQPVAWASASGVTSGTSPTTFSPGSTVTRAELVTFVWRSENRPTL